MIWYACWMFCDGIKSTLEYIPHILVKKYLEDLTILQHQQTFIDIPSSDLSTRTWGHFEGKIHPEGGDRCAQVRGGPHGLDGQAHQRPLAREPMSEAQREPRSRPHQQHESGKVKNNSRQAIYSRLMNWPTAPPPSFTTLVHGKLHFAFFILCSFLIRGFQTWAFAPICKTRNLTIGKFSAHNC